MTSSDERIEKTVTLGDDASRFEVAYVLADELAGNGLYVRNGLSPNLLDLLKYGQAHLTEPTATNGLFTLSNNDGQCAVQVDIGYADGTHQAGLNSTAVDDNPDAGADYHTVAMRNQAQTHQVELIGTNRFNFSIGFTLSDPEADRDEDGMADNWEIQYFGDTTTATHYTDYDRDGELDWKEYIALTDPTDRYDTFAVASAQRAPSAVTITFSTATNRQYYVWYAHDLVEANWTLATTNALQGTGNEMNWQDDGSHTIPTPAQATNRLYKVEVEKP